MEKNVLSKSIYTVSDFWTKVRCSAFIERSEEIGYSAATIQTENGPRLLDFVRNNEASYYTLLIYLNDDFKGGETSFDKIVVKPKTGLALFFYHYLEHEGSEVVEGVKYVLRTDIMFELKK